MNIWLIKASENLPIDINERLERMGLLAERLAANNNVVWWTSTYIHGEKKHRFSNTVSVNVDKNEKIILLHSKYGYKKNVSLKRILYCKDIATKLQKEINKEEKPDIIVCAWPIPAMAKVATEYACRNNIPIIIDVRDCWPDIFVSALSGRFKILINLLICPSQRRAKKILSSATGIAGVTEKAQEWGLKKAGRVKSLNDRVIPISCKKIENFRLDFAEEKKWIKSLGIDSESWVIVFFSTLSRRSLDLECFIKAVVSLANQYSNIILVIGGRGDGEAFYKGVANKSRNIIFTGWLDEKKMNALMSIAKCGAYCLKNTEDLRDTLSNKAVQYLSASLPIISSLEGYSKKIITDNVLGICYEENDVESCKTSILKLYTDSILVKNIKNNSERFFLENFETGIVNKNFEEYIFEVYKREKNK